MTIKTGLGIQEIIGDKREQIFQLARRHGVYNVRIFGSVAHGDATSDSDVDFLVDGLENAAWGGGRLLIELEELLGRKVDLVSEDDLHRLIREDVLKEAVVLEKENIDMKIAIGGDHAGFPLKGPIIELLRQWGHDVTDHGSYTPEPVDFPDIAQKVCQQVLAGEAKRGIMVCGTGVGAAIASNKIPGIRAAVGHDVYSAHQCVEHDDVNILCLGAQIIGDKLAAEVLRAFLSAEFSTAPEFRRRVAKLAELERQSAEKLMKDRSINRG